MKHCRLSFICKYRENKKMVVNMAVQITGSSILEYNNIEFF